MSFELPPFTKDEALKLCVDYVGGNWSHVDVNQVNLKEFTGGMSNRLYLCEINEQWLSTTVKKNEDQPSNQTKPTSNTRTSNNNKVLIRLFGGKLVTKEHPYRTLDETTEALLFFRMGRRGLGPRLLGVFPGGRIEQFIDGHTLQSLDYDDPKIEMQFARKLATMHILNIPIQKDSFDAIGLATKWSLEYRDNIKCRVNVDHMQKYHDLFEFDFVNACEWLADTRCLVPTRKVLAHHDMNNANFIIEDVTRRIYFLDFEFSAYGSRGHDLGNHFNQRMFDVKNLTSFLSTPYRDYPTEDERREFILEYLQETKNLVSHDTRFVIDEDGLDNIDTVMMDAEFGSLIYAILFSIWFIRDYDNLVKLEFGEAFFVYTTHYTKFFTERKNKFTKKYWNDALNH